MPIKRSEIRSERHKQSEKVSPNRVNGKNHRTPGSRDQWAEVLTTADRYY